MIEHPFLSYLDATVIECLDKGNPEGAIDILIEVLSVAQKSSPENRFYQAELISEAYYNLMLLYVVLKRHEEAAVAAKNAFEQDHFLFKQYPFILQSLLHVNSPEMDEVAARLVQFFEFSCDQFHDMSELLSEMYKMLEEVGDRSIYIKQELCSREYINVISGLDREDQTEEESFAKALEILDSWPALGIDQNRVDCYKSFVYYHMGRYKDVVELWGDRSFELITSPFSLAWIGMSMIQEGLEIPDSMKFPENYNVVKWALATLEIYRTIRDRVVAFGLTDKVLAELDSEGEEEKRKFFATAKFARRVAAHGMKEYDAFLSGEVNGTATALHQYIDFVDTQGELLGKTGFREEGISLLERVMAFAPTRLLARAIVDLALDMEDGDLAMKYLQWQREYVDPGDSPDDIWQYNHTLDRLDVWAYGLTCRTYAEYKEYLGKYYEKYREYYRYLEGYSVPNRKEAFPTKREYSNEFFYAAYHRIVMLQYFMEKEPDNLEIIAQLFFQYALSPTSQTDKWIEENIGLLDKLASDCDSEEGKRRFCKALAAAGFLLSVSQETYKEEDGAVVDVTIADQEKWEEGLRMLDEAERYAQDNEQFLDIVIKKLNINRAVDLHDKVLALSERGLRLLNGYTPNHLDPKLRFFPWRFLSLDMAEYPSFRFNLFATCRYWAATHLELPNELLLEYCRAWWEQLLTSSRLWYLMTKHLFPIAVQSPNSREFEEAIRCAANFRLVHAKDDLSEEEAEIIYYLARLSIVNQRFWFVEKLFDELRQKYEFLPENPDDEEESLCISKYVEQLGDALDEARMAIANRSEDDPDIEEVVSRKERSEAIIGENYISMLSPGIPSRIAKKRSPESVFRRATLALHVALLAEMVMFEFDNERFEYGVEWIHEHQFYDELTSEEAMFVDRVADSFTILRLINQRSAATALFWALGFIEKMPRTLRDIEDIHKTVELWDLDTDDISSLSLPDIGVLLDAYDLCTRIHESLAPDYVVEDAVDKDSSRHFRTHMESWAHGLCWLVDADGLDFWDFAPHFDRPPSSESEAGEEEE